MKRFNLTPEKSIGALVVILYIIVGFIFVMVFTRCSTGLPQVVQPIAEAKAVDTGVPVKVATVTPVQIAPEVLEAIKNLSAMQALLFEFITSEMAHTVCIDYEGSTPLVASECPAFVLACFHKGAPDSSAMQKCALEYFKVRP